MSGPAVAVQDLAKSYAGAAVLSIGRLEFEAARVHVVVGPNGAGKTTLLRIVNGIEPPDSGTVCLFGQDLWSSSGSGRLALRRRMACCAQRPYLFRTTVRRNVEYALRVRGMSRPERESRARAAMERLGVGRLAERPARTLSAGEAKRVSMARALVSEPELLLLDEPFASVDREGVPLVEEMLRELLAGGVTVVVATHVLEQAYRLSASVVRLEAGRVAPPAVENLLEGELVRGDSGTCLRLGGGLPIAVATDRLGRARASIAPRDIVVSAEKLDSSARNSLRGRVTALRGRGDLVFVTADTGVELTSCVTPESCRRLNLTVGSQVIFTFKATAVRIF